MREENMLSDITEAEAKTASIRVGENIDQGIEGDLLLLGGLEELEQGAELGGVHAVEPVEIVGTDPGEQTFHHGQMTDADGGGGPDGPG